MLWIGYHFLPHDGSGKAPTTALYSIVNQLDTGRRFMWNKVTRVKCPVDPASNKQIGGIVMICVGVDVAKNKHDCVILSSEGEVLADVFTIPNNAEGFDTLLQVIRRCARLEDNIKVGLEATGHYSYNILGFLLDKCLTTYVINPLHTNLYSLPRKETSRRQALQCCSLACGQEVSPFNLRYGESPAVL